MSKSRLARLKAQGVPNEKAKMLDAKEHVLAKYPDAKIYVDESWIDKTIYTITVFKHGSINLLAYGKTELEAWENAWNNIGEGDDDER